jgi:hypothetical protein
MAYLKLAASSARTRPRSFTPMPAPWPRSRTAARFSPFTDALRPFRPAPPASPARWTAATQCASVSRSALPADPADPRPGAAQPDEDGAFAPDYCQVIGQQNPNLPVTLTGLVLAHRPGQVKPRRLAVADRVLA